MARAQVLILNSRGHQRKKRSFFLLIFLLLAFIVLGFMILRQKSQVSVNSLRLYFYDTAKRELIPIQRDFEISGTQEKPSKPSLNNFLNLQKIKIWSRSFPPTPK